MKAVKTAVIRNTDTINFEINKISKGTERVRYAILSVVYVDILYLYQIAISTGESLMPKRMDISMLRPTISEYNASTCLSLYTFDPKTDMGKYLHEVYSKHNEQLEDYNFWLI